MKRNKCVFTATEVADCGHRIMAGVTTVKKNVQTIIEAPIPENTSQLKSYLDMVNYFYKFLLRQSVVVAPLHQRLAKNKPWIWSSGQEQAFHKFKELLTSTELLVNYNSTKETILACDALRYGVSPVTSHIM